MSFSEQGRSSGVAVLLGASAICAIIVALLIGQPKTGTWIAEAVIAEYPNAQGDVTASIPQVARPMRKPINPNAWAQVIEQDVTPGN